MKHRSRVAWSLIVAALVVFVTPSFAGGWATVTLDSVPSDVRSGTMISLGFMVHQHGKTPIDNNPFEGGPLQPYLLATNLATGDALRVDARKEGKLGHFVVDVTFPAAGEWKFEIVPPPFAGTAFDPLTVAAATPQPNGQSQTSVDAKNNTAIAPMTAPSTSAFATTTAWAVGAVAVVAVLTLIGVSRRVHWRQTVKRGST